MSERLSRDALLGANDLDEKDVELPSIGGSVRVVALSAAYSNKALSEANEVRVEGNTPVAKTNIAKLEALQVLYGLAEPKLNSVAEAETFLKNCGPAARKVVEAIDELSGLDKEAIEEAEARFPASGGSETGASGDELAAGSDGPAEPARASA